MGFRYLLVLIVWFLIHSGPTSSLCIIEWKLLGVSAWVHVQIQNFWPNDSLQFIDWNWLDVTVHVPKCCVMMEVTVCVWCIFKNPKCHTYFCMGCLCPINITWWTHTCGRDMKQDLMIYICVDVTNQCIHIFSTDWFSNISNNKYWSEV